MPVGGLYQTVDASQRALQGYQGAASTMSKMQRPDPSQEKTVGGAVSAAAGGALAGSAIMPGWGTAIGAGVGFISYYL